MCEAYVIPFLFGSFFTVCHPYIDVHFLKCFFCDLFLPFLGGGVCFEPGDTSRPEQAARSKVGF